MAHYRPLILLLEGEPLIAFDVEQRLTAFGFRVCGPIRSGSAALAWIAENEADAVVLDMNLLDGECSEVAKMLSSRKIPFVVHTASSKEAKAHNPVFDQGLWVSKPSLPMDLMDAVRSATIGQQEPGRYGGKTHQTQVMFQR